MSSPKPPAHDDLYRAAGGAPNAPPARAPCAQIRPKYSPLTSSMSPTRTDLNVGGEASKSKRRLWLALAKSANKQS
eukprot:5335759-Prymnesium_polylepis.1